jgi:hypothetical protein
MKRWDFAKMMNAGSKLFASIHKRKRYANPNHDVHLMARNISDWLTQGVQSIINGTYTPRFLKRLYFSEVQTAKCWTQNELLTWFINACRDANATTIATSLLNRYINSDQRDDWKPYCPKPALYRL